MVEDRVAGRKNGVAHALEGEDLHLRGHIKRCAYLLLAVARLGHHTPAVALAHSALDAVVYLLAREVDIHRATSLNLAVHTGLHHLLHVLGYGLLGIALHTRVYGGIYLQTITIDIVGLAISLEVFVTPAHNRVITILG